MKRLVVVAVPLLLMALAGCPQPPVPAGQPDAAPSKATSGSSPTLTTTTPGDPPPAVGLLPGGKKPDVPPVKAESAPPASPRVAEAPKAKDLATRITNHFAGHMGRRIYIQFDKPMYQPGETIWIKTWDLKTRAFSNDQAQGSITYQLISPKGAVVLAKNVRELKGMATNDFEIPADVQGGEYQIRTLTSDGITAERPVIVNTYEPPRIKKKLEFVRKAYGVGDEVTATIEVKRPTGQPLANKTLTAAVRLDGQDLPRVTMKTNADGEGLVRFMLPNHIEVGDGLLTVLIEDGGITESVSKSIPIILKKLQFAFFPEGGQMVAGLPTRLYFEAKNTIGKPADVEGTIVDDVGNAITTFQTYKNGLGRISFTPGTGRTYVAQITKPVGVVEKYPLPMPVQDGCALMSFDDLDGELSALRVGVRCTQPQNVVVTAMLRENLIDSAVVKVNDRDPAVVYLESKDETLSRAQGIARVTVFDESFNPLAERLVFRNRRASMKVKVEPHKSGYSPRDQVQLNVTTTTPSGKPVAAELAVSVVDDTVVSFADDKTGHMYSRMLLEPEIPNKVEEPNFFFDLTEEKSALAMDLLMGTRGWRKFEWQPVLNPQPPVSYSSPTGGAKPSGFLARLGGKKGGGVQLEEMEEAEFAAADDEDARPGRAEKKARGRPAMAMAAPQPAAPPPPEMPAPAAEPAAPAQLAQAPMAQPVVARDEPAKAKKVKADEGRVMRQQMAKEEIFADEVLDQPMAGERAARKPVDKDWAGAAATRVAEPAWAPVRVFPAPAYQPDYTGPRTDFRETIHWQPTVQTNAAGKATVTFHMSDAITSFRVFAEGAGGGLIGREEFVVQSSLPFSMGIKLPVEVSAGDKMMLPLTLSNERERPLDVALDAVFGDMLTLEKAPQNSQPKLEAGARTSVFYPVNVTGKSGKTPVAFYATASSLKDEFKRELSVTPVGFPQQASRSGKLGKAETAEFDLGDAVEGTVEASIRFYPSPVATMISGLEGMLREPYGCFEQTSSTNYPNVMVMQYLKQQDISDPRIMERSSKLIDSGYKRLTSFESPKKGYEWFGGDPGHEALTAYGVLEFADMKSVYPDVDRTMVDRTVKWIMSRRDGKGGYLRDPKALDSFGGAAPIVTNAYITYALTEAGMTDITEEIAQSAKLADESKDEYLLALAANTLLNVPARKAEGMKAADRLAGLQGKNGAWTRADHSITRSTGLNLHIETTALAVLALLKTGTNRTKVDKAIEWMAANRGGFGEWGATQATVLALKAMTQYAIANRRTQSSGTVTVSVNGKPAGEASYEAGRREPLIIQDFGKFFQKGKNVVTLSHKGGDALPYSIAIEYRSALPATSPQATIDLKTALEKSEIKMGENVRVNATVINKTQNGQPMTLARVGVPGGLAYQTWQLKELKEKGIISFYETRPREVILYFRDMKPGESKNIPIDLVANVPGEYTAPASSAYLYYTNEHRTWVEPLKVKVTM